MYLSSCDLRCEPSNLKSVVHIFLLLKESINICVVELIVDDSLSIIQVFWAVLIYSNLTIHSIVL